MRFRRVLLEKNGEYSTRFQPRWPGEQVKNGNVHQRQQSWWRRQQLMTLTGVGERAATVPSRGDRNPPLDVGRSFIQFEV